MDTIQVWEVLSRPSFQGRRVVKLSAHFKVLYNAAQIHIIHSQHVLQGFSEFLLFYHRMADCHVIAANLVLWCGGTKLYWPNILFSAYYLLSLTGFLHLCIEKYAKTWPNCRAVHHMEISWRNIGSRILYFKLFVLFCNMVVYLGFGKLHHSVNLSVLTKPFTPFLRKFQPEYVYT